MKVNEAPEKIYFSQTEDGRQYFTPAIPFEREFVEYMPVDAFIEKACEWLKNHYRDYMYNATGERLEAFFGGDMCNDFEDYMKGE
jgi:hypothetical protein